MWIATNPDELALTPNCARYRKAGDPFIDGVITAIVIALASRAELNHQRIRLENAKTATPAARTDNAACQA